MITASLFGKILTPKTILLFTIVFTIAYFFLAHEGFYFNDDYTYAQMAGSLLPGHAPILPTIPPEPDLPSNHRFMIFWPVALLYKLFGVNIYVVTLWPLLCTIGCLVYLYILFRKEDSQLAVWAILLLGLNFHTLFLTVYFFPDNIFMFFALLAAGILYSGRRSSTNGSWWAVGFVFANLAAFLGKETIIWYVPFYFIVGFFDFFRKKHTVFWLTSFGFGAVVLFVYLLLYKVSFGSFFYRFTLVENTNLIMENNYVRDASKSLWPRLTIAPFGFLIASGIFFLIAFCFRFFRNKNRRAFTNFEKGEVFWFWLALLVLLEFWLGSTSLKFYNPITLVPRMATPLFPPLAIAAAYQLRNYFRETTGAIWFAIPLFIAAFFDRSAMSIVYGLPGCYFLFCWWQARKRSVFISPVFFIILLVFSLALRPLHFMQKPTVSAFFEQEEIIKELIKHTSQKTAVFTDGWFEKSESYYFAFKPHALIKILNYQDVSTTDLTQFGQVYLLVNKSTLTNPDLQLNPPQFRFTIQEDKIYRLFPNRKEVARKGNVVLYKISKP